MDINLEGLKSCDVYHLADLALIKDGLVVPLCSSESIRNQNTPVMCEFESCMLHSKNTIGEEANGEIT